jgi:hypothetical protein
MGGRGTLYFLRGFFLYIIRRKNQRSCDGHDGGLGTYSNMKYKKRDKKRAVLHLRGFFPKTGISPYNINFAQRNSEAAMGGGGGEYIFRVQHTGRSVRVQHSSNRVQRSSVGCSIA